MPSLLPDITPLRASREFRLLWIGQLISQSGSALRLVAVPYQVYVLTQSSLAVGLLGLFSAVPLIAISLWGGVIADRVDRRRMLLVTNAGLALVSVALAVATQTGNASVPLLYLLTFVGSGVGALDQPARSALAPSLVERRLIPAAMALNQTQFQVATVVGPAVAGVVIAQFGLAYAYWIDVATFAAAFVALMLMRIPRSTEVVVHASPARALADGMAFLLPRSPRAPTRSPRSSGTRSCSSRRPMPSAAVSRRSTSCSSRAARSSVRRSRASSRRCGRRRRRSSPVVSHASASCSWRTPSRRR